jgi:O-antigen/teichoic acid export membrane protein
MVIPRTKKEVAHFVKHPLAINSFLVFSSTLLGNIFAYLFNIFAAKMLGPSDYGVLAAVIALMGITGVFSMSLSMTVTKFVSGYKGGGQEYEITSLVSNLTKIFLLLGIVVLSLSVIFEKPLAQFFNIPYQYTIIFVGAMFLISLLSTINLGTISGLQNFSFIALASFSQTFIKFVLGLSLIYLGFKVNGASLGIVLAAFIVYLMTLFPLKGKVVFNLSSIKLPWRKFVSYSVPALFSMWGIISLQSTDVVLVKKFFDPDFAGVYSFTALVGRVIFFASSSTSAVMFPLVSERLSAGRRYKHLFFYSLVMTLVISLSIATFYSAFPRVTLMFFSGFGKSAYLSGAQFVGVIGFYYVIFSLCNNLTSFFLSIHKTFVASVLPTTAAVLQIILISRFHATVWEVLGSSLISSIFLLGAFLLYLSFYDRER